MPVSHLDNSVAEILAFGLNEATGGSYSHLTTSEDQMLALLVSEMTGQEYSHLTTGRETLWELLLTQAAADGITFDRNNQSNEQIAAIIANNVSAGEEYEGPLDIVPGAGVAYSVSRALSAEMLGQDAYTLRRELDDAELTFAYDAVTGEVDVDAIATWIGESEGAPRLAFNVSWKDHSGNSAHLNQATAINQAPWSPSEQGDKPAFLATGTSAEFLAATALSLPAGEYTVFCVCRSSIHFFGQTGGEYFEFGFESGTPYFDASDGVGEAYADFDGSGVSDIDYVLWEGFNGIGNHGCFASGVELISNGDSDSGASLGPITQALGISGMNATEGIQELIIYPSILSAPERISVRQNIAAYYGITL